MTWTDLFPEFATGFPRSIRSRSPGCTYILTASIYVIFAILAYMGSTMSGPAPMVAVVWPASAVGLAMLIRQSRSRTQDMWGLAATFAGGMTASMLMGHFGLRYVSYNAINTISIFLGLMAARRFRIGHMGEILPALRFGMAVIVAPSLLGAILAGVVSYVAGQAWWLENVQNWFTSNFLGYAIILPFGMAVSWRQLRKLKLERRGLEAAIVFIILTAISYYALRLAPRPMQFLVLAAAIVATVRFRMLGAGAAMFIILVIMFLSLPQAAIPTDFAQRSGIAQLFLAVCSIVTARAALMLNQRDLHVAIIERHRRRALRAARFKTQLLAHVSNEVRGPLSAIIGFSGMLESGKLPTDRATEFAHVVAHNGELLQRLHDDLEDLARAEQGALNLGAERIAVGPMLRDCIGSIRLEAALGGKPVLIETIEDNLAVAADPKRLAQILNNLIANAFKYGDNISPIRVRASRLGDGFGRIEILNAGPGISLRERQALFQPFRTDAGGRQVPGAGLGLSIAKMLVERQGGRIDFESIPGHQTRFWIDLPLAA